MTTRIPELLDEVPALEASDRTERTAELLTSRDAVPDADSARAWEAEIARRARDAVADPDDDISWESVRAELHAAPSGCHHR